MTAYLGLGSNLGDRVEALRGGREALAVLDEVSVVAGSALYETAPLGGPPGQDPYLNGVLEIATTLTADRLLENCLRIEAAFGRQRLVHHGPRTLDIDLLFYDDLVCRNKDLTLPHPRLHQRAFVLIPLCDLAPDLIHPLLGFTLRQLRDRLDENQGVKRLPLIW